ncbi:MAG: thioredoxin domain-containing protein [Phycisphaerales bacterium]
MSNSLANEKSPYLLQHAFNPVPWYPWGDAAIAQARLRDVPLLVSTGYSTCYWCHVMERECFENPDIARLMGEKFVCVKVDREQRPDLDALWMTACQVFTSITEGRSSGGWPLHVFLEPKSLRPFFAGTYFPPTPAHGRISFPQLLMRMSDAWLHKRADIEAQANELTRLVEQELQLAPLRKPLDEEMEINTVRALLTFHDAVNGGFGGAPKFPQPSLPLFLQAAAGEMAQFALVRTLDGMALGGVRDQLDGGFHRYAVDATWTVPHFEKMLYDQGQLLLLYARQAHVGGDEFFTAVTCELAEFLLDVMRLPSGGFMAAIDAEVDGREGLNYIWSKHEVTRALERAGLEKDVPLAVDAFGLSASPNFRDPHHPEDEPKFVLILRARPQELATKMNVELAQWWTRYNAVRQALLAERALRKSPRMDTTLIAGWNGLAIEGLAEAGRLCNQPRWIEAAARAADDVLTQLHSAQPSSAATISKTTVQSDTLYRSAKDGVVSSPGFLEDYACFAAGLLALTRATNDPRWLAHATAIVQSACEKCWRADLGWVEALANDSGRILSISGIDDGAVPSGAGVITQCLVTLAQLTKNNLWAERAFAGLDRASGAIAQKPTSAARSLMAARELRQLLPGRVPGGAEPSPVRMQLVAMNHSFDEFELRLDIDAGHHVAAHEIAAAGASGAVSESAIPSVSGMDISARDTGVTLKCIFPNATHRSDGSQCYQGRVVILVSVITPRPTPRPLRLGVRMQICTDISCLAPEDRLIEG